MGLYFQSKKLQKYYLGSPVSPAEYKTGDLNIIRGFNTIEDCEQNIIIDYNWKYPLNTAGVNVLGTNTGFTLLYGYSDDNYDYYAVVGSGTKISFRNGVISGGTLDTSNMTTLKDILSTCYNLTSLDVSTWNTSNVTSMEQMLYGCTSLPTLDLSSWDVSKVTTMEDMFGNCTSLTSVDLSGWDTKSLTNMYEMFLQCESLNEIIGIKNLNVSNVTTMYMLFSICRSLPSLDLSGWDTDKVTTMKSIFYECNALTSLNLSGWNTSSVTNIQNAFHNCTSLETLDISGWDISNANTATQFPSLNVFGNCNALRTIYMRGCNSTTISKIESALTSAGIRDNVTIVTE